MRTDGTEQIIKKRWRKMYFSVAIWKHNRDGYQKYCYLFFDSAIYFIYF